MQTKQSAIVPPRYEEVPRQGLGSFSVREFNLPAFPFIWHHHPELEITYIVRGHGMRYVGDSIETYEPGDLCLLGSYTPHTYLSEEQPGGVRSLVLHFSLDLWRSILAALPELKPVEEMLARARTGLRFAGQTRLCGGDAMTSLFAAPEGSPERVSAFIKVLIRMAAGNPDDVTELASTDTRPDHPGHVIVTRVLAELHRAGNDPPPQAELAASLRLSPSAFSRIFKRQMGKNYVDYANHWRLGHACRLLVQTDDDITSIAFAAGFNNLSNFNRRFREAKGMTPREYRALAKLDPTRLPQDRR